MTGQAYAFSLLLFAVLTLGLMMGFAIGRLSSRPRGRGHGESDSEAALAMALEDGLARLKAQRQVQAERADASERLNSRIVENLTAGLVLVDGLGHVALVNPAARRLLDLPSPREDAALAEVLAPAPELVAVIESSRATHEPVVRRTVSVVLGARTLHLGVTVSVVDHGEGPGAVICLFSDLTSIVEMEDQLRLKDALARLGELTAGLAHEFRNGLATIHGYARLLDPALLPERYRPYVESLREETTQLGRVVTNFLAFARPESLSFAQVRLRDLVVKAADAARREGPGAPTIDVEGSFDIVHGDEALLTQVFDNLFRNAVEACTRAGVSPRISVRGDIDAATGVQHVLVEDNGPGIPDSARARVFQPFFTTRPDGTGLGLAIVQKIVLAHNGRITLVPVREGQGAIFEMAFPLSGAASRLEVPPAA